MWIWDTPLLPPDSARICESIWRYTTGASRSGKYTTGATSRHIRFGAKIAVFMFVDVFRFFIFPDFRGSHDDLRSFVAKNVVFARIYCSVFPVFWRSRRSVSVRGSTKQARKKTAPCQFETTVSEMFRYEAAPIFVISSFCFCFLAVARKFFGTRQRQF